AKVSEVSAADSLSKIGSAIADSSVPFPDVWIPFNDSLRMLAGYGDDIKVGGYTVATQASFSRASTATYIDKSGVLRTAAINEPRFEKEGLLIEGQSTNLITTSSGVRWTDGSGPAPSTLEDNTDPQTENLIAKVDKTVGSGIRRRPYFGSILTVGTTYCVSFRARIYKGRITQSASAFTGASYPPVVDGVWATYFFSGVATNSVFEMTIQQSDSIEIAWIQLEALPFATSYIPTNGAAATRAGDVCKLLGTNLPVEAKTVSFEFDYQFNTGNTHGHSLIRENSFLVTDRQTIAISGDGELSLCEGDGVLGRHKPEHTKDNYLVGVFNGPNSKFVFNGESLTQQVRPITKHNRVYQTSWELGNNQSYHSPINGHIRNFRIWHRALTDAQIKGLK
ncbi:MAG: phage head spike fiber domain-containing protein, partial [Aeromonas veronii]